LSDYCRQNATHSDAFKNIHAKDLRFGRLCAHSRIVRKQQETPMTYTRNQADKYRTRERKASSAFTDWAIANGMGHMKPVEYRKAVIGTKGETLLALADAAREVRVAHEDAAVAAHKAWRGTLGLVSFYR
jgi:hypothetical protein